jgi:glycine hydroxymethyltransferase
MTNSAMYDQVIFDLIKKEEKRQREGLELIPSENYVSRQVLDAMGSVFTNKYSEGYVGKRYYGGQQNTDVLEQLCIDRVKELFGCDHANVQPLGGATANEIMYHAVLEPGDTIMAMRLDHGGHLTHGHPVTYLAKVYNFVRYGMKDAETGEIDFDDLRATALKVKPKMLLVGFSAYPRELDYKKFAEIGNEVGAILVADMAHISGLIAGKALKNPFDYGFHIMTSTTHKTMRGPRGGMILSQGKVSNPLKAPEKTIENIPTLIDRMVFPGMQGGPHMHQIAAKAVAFHEALQPEYKEYCIQVLKNAKALAQGLSERGFKLVTGGTDNHLILADVQTSFGIDGAVAEDALDSMGLTMNKNSIPFDTAPPFKPSGLRLGTPAVTTRGMKEEDMFQIAEWMRSGIEARDNSSELKKLKKQVQEFALKFPLPSDK